eukprot:995679-Heterocapsa_arctica.AAC.1
MVLGGPYCEGWITKSMRWSVVRCIIRLDFCIRLVIWAAPLMCRRFAVRGVLALGGAASCAAAAGTGI